MRIIGITGTLGAGKGTVVEYLTQHKGFKHYSARALLNEIIAERGLAPGRDTMVELANAMRAEKGPAALIEALFQRAIAVGEDAIIESVRTEGEVTALRSFGTPFMLLAVDAAQRTRYDRAFARGSSTDDVSFEKFVEQEQREMSSTEPHEQNLSRCMALADARLTNDGEHAQQTISPTLYQPTPKRCALGSRLDTGTQADFHAAIEAFLSTECRQSAPGST